MDFKQFLKGLQGIVGEENVVYHSDDLLVFEYDGSVDRGLPDAVVFPADTQEVSRVIALAHGAGVPEVGRGAGTGLSGGAIASPGSIQVAFTRMNRILEVDTENRMALVEPGVVNLDLDTHVRKSGLRYAPDPSSQKACSLGGNIAENAGGPHCLAYGTTTNHVLGLEVVLEDGTVVNLGSLARETVGYDLRGVFTGSEGTFGIATKIAVRLLPVPESVRTLLGIFPDVATACTAVSAVIEHGIVPAALEMIDALTIQAVQKVNDAAEERELLWVGRKGALGALGSIAPNYFLVDGVVPRTQLAQVLGQVAEIGRKYDIPIANVFHAGDGNLHPCLLFDERQPGALEKIVEAGTEVLRVCVDAGGTLTGEHGVGLEKKEQMPLVFTGDDMAAMVLVRDAFAPDNSLNPGKIFPGGKKHTPSAHPAATGMTI